VLEGIAAATVAFESGKYNTAFELSQVLAVQGNADAQFYLGKMYEEGLGCPADINTSPYVV
jgi:TPR repeat protein